MTATTLYEFDTPGAVAGWTIVNDGVMGGRSRSRIDASGDGIAVFEGEVSRENDGGFASVRSGAGPLPTAGAAALLVRVRGDGRAYQLRVRTDDDADGIAYRWTFDTTPGEWITLRAPFEAFDPVFRGRVVPDAPPLDPSAIRQLGFLIADGEAGPFRLEIDRIAAEA